MLLKYPQLLSFIGSVSYPEDESMAREKHLLHCSVLQCQHLAGHSQDPTMHMARQVCRIK